MLNGKERDKQDWMSPVSTGLLQAWKQEWELIGNFKYFLNEVHMKFEKMSLARHELQM